MMPRFHLKGTHPKIIEIDKYIVLRNSLIKRFWSFVDKKNKDDCWEWTGSLNKGYGQIAYIRKPQQSHRISYELHYGEIPSGMFICHKCNNPKCCNPNHLYAGTPADNHNDSVIAGTAVDPPKIKPIDSVRRKLDWNKVDDIRSSNLNGVELAKKYNVSKSLINHVRNNRMWKECNR